MFLFFAVLLTLFWFSSKIYVPSLSVLILFGACSATSIVFFNWERCKHRRVWVVYITGAAYLIAIAVIGYDFSRFPLWWMKIYGPGSWTIKLAVYHLMPLSTIIVMNLPFGITTELVFFTILTFFVIIPIGLSAFSLSFFCFFLLG